MNDPTKAKVMYPVLGKPMVYYVMKVAYRLGADDVVPVVGYMRDAVMEFLKSEFPNAVPAIQAEQLGTGHAVMQTESILTGFDGDVLVLSGDAPLLTTETLKRLLLHHRSARAVATVLTAMLDDPTGYGRVMRHADGAVEKIVEHKDATEQERRVREINSGIYVFDTKMLFESLRHITPHNVQKEYYLTDVFDFFWKHHLRVSALEAPHPDEIRGINTVEQLAEAEKILSRRTADVPTPI